MALKPVILSRLRDKAMLMPKKQNPDAGQAFAMITELIDIGVPVEKLHKQGLADFEFEYIEMHPKDGLWSDLLD